MRIKAFILGIVSLVTTACMPAYIRVDQQANDYAFDKTIVKGTQFEHVVYQNAEAHQVLIGVNQPPLSKPVHVYIEGDGTPWIKRVVVARDPTPARPIMLELMSLDRSPAIYLGRPCYFGLSHTKECGMRYWTSHRYSPEVIDSMVAALTQILEPGQEVKLFGHSGGGTIAVLLAERLASVNTPVKTIVTLAGNLDTREWTRHHGYASLWGSLNPSALAPLPANITQYHYAGGEDKNVLPRFIKTYSEKQAQAHYHSYDAYQHGCCWREVWLQILATIK